MTEISISELRRNTGAWVRGTRKYGSILVRDRSMLAAVLTPVSSAAEVAAMAIEHGATLDTTDRDFARFDGLKSVNPLDQT